MSHTPRVANHVSLDELIRLYLAEKRQTRAMRPESLAAIRGRLWRFASLVGGARPAASIDKAVVLGWVGGCDVGPATLGSYLSAVRSLFEWAVDEGHVVVNPAGRLKSPKRPPRVARAFDPEQIVSIEAACVSLRDRVIVSLMYREGLRAGGVASLRREDVDLRGSVLVVCEKGDKEREVPLTDATRVLLARYMGEDRSGTVVRSKKCPRDGVTAGYVSQTVARILYCAGIKTAARDGVTGHRLRHTAATELLEACGDITIVQDFLGHESLDTTRIYTRRTRTSKIREAMSARSAVAAPVGGDLAGVGDDPVGVDEQRFAVR